MARRQGGGGPRGARPGFALGAAEEAPSEDDVDSDDVNADAEADDIAPSRQAGERQVADTMQSSFHVLREGRGLTRQEVSIKKTFLWGSNP